MATMSKPEFKGVWAGSGNKVKPDDGKISTGWVVEIPAHQNQNWIDHRQDAMLGHINQFGIPEWDATTEYIAKRSYVQGSSGTVFRAISTNTGINPETDRNNNWEKPFDLAPPEEIGEPAPALDALIRTNNLSDVPDKAAARANLGITGGGNAGRGLVVDGDAIALGTPSHITATSTNSVGANSHTHAIDVNSLFNQSATPSGYITLPGGILFQWGRGAAFGEGTASMNFPKPFTEACWSLQLTTIQNEWGPSLETIASVITMNNTGFTYGQGWAGPRSTLMSTMYFAIGK